MTNNRPNNRARVLEDMLQSLREDLERVDEYVNSLSLPRLQGMYTLDQLQQSSTVFLSGKLDKLQTDSGMNSSEREPLFKRKLLVLTLDGNLYLFRNETTPAATYLPLTSCSGYYDELYNSWMLRVAGSGVGLEGIQSRTWVMKISDSRALLIWLEAINQIIVRSREKSIAEQSAMFRRPERKDSLANSNSLERFRSASTSPSLSMAPTLASTVMSPSNCNMSAWSPIPSLSPTPSSLSRPSFQKQTTQDANMSKQKPTIQASEKKRWWQWVNTL
ncbi:hypothetical protein BC830DRAFT_1111040 [Chytriomyces sp. MP71]|nr:hypothetical protein BC830DRAFT_1111040 [Chytriomyces sp. MP71]